MSSEPKILGPDRRLWRSALALRRGKGEDKGCGQTHGVDALCGLGVDLGVLAVPLFDTSCSLAFSSGKRGEHVYSWALWISEVPVPAPPWEGSACSEASLRARRSHAHLCWGRRGHWRAACLCPEESSHRNQLGQHWGGGPPGEGGSWGRGLPGRGCEVGKQDPGCRQVG